MKIIKNKTVQVSALIAAMGLVALPMSSAQADIWWPGISDDGGTGGGTGGETAGGTYDEGFNDGMQTCQDDPGACNISLNQFAGNSGFGETEPNDKAFSADGLVQGENYHGNSFDYFDEDWYYIQTTKNNQNITVSFAGEIEGAGWLISVRDAAGNIIATYDSAATSIEAEGTATSSERTIVVTAGNPGTYYITVQPYEEGTGESEGTYKSYKIAAVLSDPGQTSPNPDTNFMDVELEPNDTKSQATALSSTTNMFAYFDKVPASATTFHFDSDWFKYRSNGNEILNLRMCSKESCGRSEQSEVSTTEFTRIWHLTIVNAGGQVLLDGPIQPGQSVNAAITFSGDYYINFGTENTGESVCPSPAECEPAQEVPIVHDASGAYNFTVTGTSLSPTTP